MATSTKAPPFRLVYDERVAVWRALLEAHSRVLEAVEQDLVQDLQLPLSWFEVLLHLARTPEGSLRMQDLASKTLLSKSGLTRLADRIESAGLIERTSCASDRRGTFATLTKKGL